MLQVRKGSFQPQCLLQPLTRELGEDLFDRHATGVRVAVGAVRRDQVVGGVDGGLDTCCTRFLWRAQNLRTGRYFGFLTPLWSRDKTVVM